MYQCGNADGQLWEGGAGLSTTSQRSHCQYCAQVQQYCVYKHCTYEQVLQKKLKLKLWVRTVVKKTKFYCLIIFFYNQNLLKLWYVGKVSLYVTVKNKNYNILEMPDTFRTVFIIVSSCGLGVRFQCTLTKNFTFLTVFMIVSGNGLATRFRCALRISGSSM